MPLFVTVCHSQIEYFFQSSHTVISNKTPTEDNIHSLLNSLIMARIDFPDVTKNVTEMASDCKTTTTKN